ncbi:hypothetical protein E2C01_073353 [Portunus trituberculatus]|uniref:Uncharacterized protein n=1 Tax=Portunus trituberculatus TaxID=210409 RepID=A0A5B7I0G9_PORTR|nr:hypothetical protein [Portunus trituberculatus]
MSEKIKKDLEASLFFLIPSVHLLSPSFIPSGSSIFTPSSSSSSSSSYFCSCGSLILKLDIKNSEGKTKLL